MKQLLLILLLLITPFLMADDTVYLLVRADDMGSSHAANLACLDAYTKGIVRSVEVMPVCPWFMECVEMLKKHPEHDVGIHLALTSEWSLYRWRPIKEAPSLTDDDGYFFPMVWRNSNFPPNHSIAEADWKIEEIEAELRAQIEKTLKYLPHTSHMGSHMGFASLDPQIKELMVRLADEYDLIYDNYGTDSLQGFRPWQDPQSVDDAVQQMIANLKKLTPGNYIMVTHPAYNNPEMHPIQHIGYTDVGEERDRETRVLTDPRIKQAIEDLGIVLINYKEIPQ